MLQLTNEMNYCLPRFLLSLFCLTTINQEPKIFGHDIKAPYFRKTHLVASYTQSAMPDIKSNICLLGLEGMIKRIYEQIKALRGIHYDNINTVITNQEYRNFI